MIINKLFKTMNASEHKITMLSHEIGMSYLNIINVSLENSTQNPFISLIISRTRMETAFCANGR